MMPSWSGTTDWFRWGGKGGEGRGGEGRGKVSPFPSAMSQSVSHLPPPRPLQNDPHVFYLPRATPSNRCKGPAKYDGNRGSRTCSNNHLPPDLATNHLVNEWIACSILRGRRIKTI